MPHMNVAEYVAATYSVLLRMKISGAFNDSSFLVKGTYDLESRSYFHIPRPFILITLSTDVSSVEPSLSWRVSSFKLQSLRFEGNKHCSRSIRMGKLFAIYPSTTASDFHCPCRLRLMKLTPTSVHPS